MTKTVLLLSAVISALLAAAPRPGGVPQSAAGGKAAPETLARAKKIYAVDCAVCHGDTGNGQTDLATSMQLKLADWTDAKTLADKTDQALFEIIRNGKDKMPPEDSGRAKDDDVRGLVTYIRGFSKLQQAAAGPGK
jgi:mono/diheme cytochrome c family protein